MSNANAVLEIKKNRLQLYYEAEEKVLPWIDFIFYY